MKGQAENQISNEDPTLYYDLLQLIGKGSFGSVYLAKELKTNEFVFASDFSIF